MKMEGGMALPLWDTTLSSTDVVESTERWLSGSEPKDDPSMRSSSGTTSKSIAHQCTTQCHHGPRCGHMVRRMGGGGGSVGNRRTAP
jgi:hypothetical protein